MHHALDTVEHLSHRALALAQWAESVFVLCVLAAQGAPRTSMDVAHSVGAPEMPTRGRLTRLEAHGAVRATKWVAVLGP